MKRPRFCQPHTAVFKIMGFNFRACGFANVQAYVQAQAVNEGAQLLAFCNFIKADSAIHKALKAKALGSICSGIQRRKPAK